MSVAFSEEENVHIPESYPIRLAMVEQDNNEKIMGG